MSRGSSNKLLELVSSDTPNDIFLHLVTVFWPDNTEDRYVKNYEDVTSRGNNYQAASFNINLPAEPEDEVPTINLQFSIAERTIVRKLRESTTPPTLRLEVVLASDPDIVEVGPFDFDLRRFDSQGMNVSVEAGFEPILDLALPQLTYNPILFAGLFKSVRSDA